MRDTKFRPHDPRLLDLIAVLALLFVVVGVLDFLRHPTSDASIKTSFIVPSQTVHW